MISELDLYRFDLKGYIILEGALSADELKACNDVLDEMPRMAHGDWHGHVQSHTYGHNDGINYQQIYEAGPAFEKLIDHPSWHEHMLRFAGPGKSFDAHHGELFIDEAFASIRGPGESIGMHSGADQCSKRNAYQYRDGHFMCGQVNALIALNDIGPGDGGTTVIPGSHKQNMQHPLMMEYAMGEGKDSGDLMPEMIEVHLKAGDVLLFTDTICHGSAKRVNPGERRIVVYRYGPSWGMFRHGYRPSPELLERLTERQRQIVWPHAHTLYPPTAVPMA